MNDDVKTSGSVAYLKQELKKCNPLNANTTERAAIIEWRLKQLGQV
jgi:hypothetical protein